MIRRRRVGSPVLRTAAAVSVGAAVGSSAARGAAREADQNARIAQLEQQQAAPPPPVAPEPSPAVAAPPSPPAATEPSAPTPSPAPVSMDQKIAQLKELGGLRDAGILTEAEFAAQKEKVLAGT